MNYTFLWAIAGQEKDLLSGDGISLTYPTIIYLWDI